MRKRLLVLLFIGVLLLFTKTAATNAIAPLDVQYNHHKGGNATLADPQGLEDAALFSYVNPYEWDELSRYILRYKMKYDGGIWNVCGKTLNNEEMKKASIEWAYEVLHAHESTPYPLRYGRRHLTVKVPYKGALGVMMAESRLDHCAMGPHPRKWAYKKGLLKRNPGNPGTPSYTTEEILSVLNHPAWRKRLADLGPGQIVWGRSKRAIFKGDPEELISLKPGIKRVFEEMADRGKRKNSKYPWEYWPGERRHLWYGIHISNFVRQIFYPILKDG